MSVPFGASAGPGRFAVFLMETDTGAPMANVPVFATAQLVLGQGGDGQSIPQQSAEITLGVLASDHAGYISWDLEPLRRQTEILAEKPTGGSLASQLNGLSLHLYGPLQSVVDALPSAQIGPEAIVLRLAVDRNGVYAADAGSYPSMQSPTLVDLNLSPGSFANVPAMLVGQDGCEALLPSNVATQHFQVHQIVQLPSAYDVTITSPKPAPAPKAVNAPGGHDLVVAKPLAQSMVKPEFAPLAFNGNTQLALIVNYDVTWIPVGHGLGQVAYSLPLAPGEQVNLAIVDWARQSTDSRSEETMLTDTLEHSQVRDRTVDEVVSATVHEFQAGGSLLGGIAAAVSSAYGSAVGSIGGGYSTTQGDRDVSSQTVQSLQDSFAQHSTAVRDLRSTVVVQSRQSEQASAQTRTVRNHNHAHAMTLLYYEVLRHFRVVVERADVTPAVLIPAPMPDFDEGHIYAYRRYLEPGLIDASLLPGFDAVEKYFAWTLLPLPAPPDPFAQMIRSFSIALQVDIPSITGGTLRAKAILNDGTSITLQRNDSLKPADQLQQDGNFQQSSRTESFVAVPASSITRRQLSEVDFSFTFDGDSGDPGSVDNKFAISFAGGSVAAIMSDGTNMLVGQLTTPTTLDPHVQGSTGTFTIFTSALPPAPPAPTPESKLSDDENLLRVRLKYHLDNNKSYYYRLIWLGEDPNSRYQRLRGSTVNVHGQVRPIFEAITNRALDVLGDSTAFALDPSLIDVATNSNIHGTMPALPVVAPARDERVVSLPTRGIFAEAKLGHCNAAEVIDDTRFWDWQKSPDPDSAPAITDIGLGTRDVQTSTTPTAFPSSMVNIVNPPSAPDPVAMAGALALLGKSDIFRDMSTSSEVASLLQSLASDATSLAGKQIDKSGGGGATSGGAAASGGGATGSSGSSSGGTVAAPTGGSGGGAAAPASGASATGSTSGATSSGSTGASGTTGSDSGTAPTATASQPTVSPAPTPVPVAPRAAPSPPQPITAVSRTFIFNFFQIDASDMSGYKNATGAVGRFTVQLQQGGKPVGELSGDLGQPFIMSANVDPKVALHVYVSGTVTISGPDPQSTLPFPPALPLKSYTYQGQHDFTLAAGVKQYLFEVSRTSATGSQTFSRATIEQSSSTVKELVSLALGSNTEVATVNGSYGSEDSRTLLSGTTTTTSVTVPYVAYTGGLLIASDVSMATG
ncbi:MAG TPA: hypothetical protein VN602_02125 [Gemmatimonadaceae bacterium]|nr:hypothetical protein [Gemmatimonadaceae bacterium]